MYCNREDGNMRAQLLIDPGVKLGEGPIWDNQRRVLTWVDITGKTFYIFNPQTGENQSFSTPQMVSFVAYLDSDRFLVALEDGLYTYEKGKFTLQKKLPGYNGKIRFNDGAYDKYGRLYIGTMGLEEEDRLNHGAGSLYLYEKGELITILTGVTISNGIAFDYSRKRFYFNDTKTRRVSLFDYDEETGVISHRREFANLESERGFPDGLTIDSFGNIYVALWQGNGVKIYNPQGEYVGFIDVDEDNVTSVEFGWLGNLAGKFQNRVNDKRTGESEGEQVLYITTAQNSEGRGGGLYYFPVKELEVRSCCC